MCVDLAKVFALIFMVAVHTMMYGGSKFDETLSLLVGWVFGGPLSAPVFMVCMGIGVTYSRHNDAASLFCRGWKLLLVSYLFNAIRALCYPLMAWGTGDGTYLSQFVHLLFFVDILQFAGVAFILLALLRKLNASVGVVIAVGLVLSAVGSFVHDMSTGIIPVDILLSLIEGVPTEPVFSAFPLLNWFIFVALGLGIGKLMRCCNDLDRVFAWITPVSAVIFIGLTAWMLPNHYGLYEGTETAYYYMNILEALTVGMSAALLSLGVGHFIGKLVKGKTAELVQRTSSDLNKIYLVHWVILMWVVDCLLCRILDFEFSSVEQLLIAFVVLIVSAWIARRKPISNIKL